MVLGPGKEFVFIMPAGARPLLAQAGRRYPSTGCASRRRSTTADIAFEKGDRGITMGTFIGIDGFRFGWVGCYFDENGNQRFDYSGRLERLIAGPYVRAMIDIPIGLPDHGYRQCDVEAQQYLRARVFTGARWGVWDFEGYEDANRHYRANGEKGISKQLWGLRDKLQEVNETTPLARQVRLQETHPELVFMRLAGCVLANKKTEFGRNQRIDLLKKHGVRKIETWLNQRYGTGIGGDDLIDACACALAARDMVGHLPFHGVAPKDERGIQMEIWY